MTLVVSSLFLKLVRLRGGQELSKTLGIRILDKTKPQRKGPLHKSVLVRVRELSGTEVLLGLQPLTTSIHDIGSMYESKARVGAHQEIIFATETGERLKKASKLKDCISVGEEDVDELVLSVIRTETIPGMQARHTAEQRKVKQELGEQYRKKFLVKLDRSGAIATNGVCADSPTVISLNQARAKALAELTRQHRTEHEEKTELLRGASRRKCKNRVKLKHQLNRMD